MSLDPKVGRRYQMLLALRSRDWVSAQSLAERFDVSARTVYRDVEELLSYGIPIEGLRGPEGGYRLRPESPLDPLILSSEDAFALFLEQEKGVESDVGAHAPGLRYTPESLRRRIYFDTSDWYWRGESSGWLDLLREAATSTTAVQIAFRDRGAAESRQLLVLPYGLAWKAGEWYLVGPELNGPISRYALSRMGSVSTTTLTFPMPADFDIAREWQRLVDEFGCGETEVVIAVSASAKPDLLRLHRKADSKVEEYEDGTAKITLLVDSWEWLIPLLASFGAAVQVITPDGLREATVSFLRSALEAYEVDALGGSGNGGQFGHLSVPASKGRILSEGHE